MQAPDDFREVLYTVDKHGRRRWVYTALTKGWWFHRRAIVAYTLMLIYLVMPWLTVNDKQAVFLNVAHRQFTFFGTTFWASDTIFLVLVLAILGICLFFFTALFGRVWCGWACPETVFLEFLFRPIERFIEGGPAQRLRLDAAPWTVQKFGRKFAKYALFLLCAWVLANTFLAYFVGRDALLDMIAHSPRHNPGAFGFMLAFVGVVMFQFTWFREQFCTILCPYARFQSVMMDVDSLAVGYDRTRGEPRGKPGSVAGDCVDCGLCQRVCPTGIDIRNGLQLECVACTACIDACDGIMTGLGRKPGLIRYATERELGGERSKVVRGRIIFYSLALLVLIAVLVYRLTHRVEFDAQVLRGALDAPFTLANEATVQNHLTLKIANKSDRAATYTLLTSDPSIGVTLPLQPFPVAAGQVASEPVFFTFPRNRLRTGKLAVDIEIRDDGGAIVRQSITLLGPDQ